MKLWIKQNSNTSATRLKIYLKDWKSTELSADKDRNVNWNSCPCPHIGEKPTVFLILTSHNLKAIIVELMSTGGRYILALHQKLIYHCLMFTKFRFCFGATLVRSEIFDFCSDILCNFRLVLSKMLLKCKVLSPLMLAVCTLSHGNVDPGRGFCLVFMAYRPTKRPLKPLFSQRLY